MKLKNLIIILISVIMLGLFLSGTTEKTTNVIYEESVEIENWMTQPFFEEPVKIENWMSQPFIN